MIDFYDLSSEEQANLTEEEVRAFVRVACMEAGVILGEEVEEPTFLNEPDVPMENVTRYKIEGDEMPDSNIVFETQADAQVFLELDILGVHKKYLGSYHRTLEFTRQIGPLRIVSIEMPKEEALLSKLAELEESATNAKTNEELRSRLRKRERNIENAAKPIWNSYREAKERVRKLEEVRVCYTEYLELAKDEASANACMLKAYDDTVLLEDALGGGWDQIDISVPLPACEE